MCRDALTGIRTDALLCHVAAHARPCARLEKSQSMHGYVTMNTYLPGDPMERCCQQRPRAGLLTVAWWLQGRVLCYVSTTSGSRIDSENPNIQDYFLGLSWR